MARIIWAEPALDDLNEIAEYIALDNPEAAKSLVQKIFNAVTRLQRFPNSGRKPPEFKRTRYKEIIVGPCRIFYRTEKTTVTVLYVMRSERQLRQFILKDRGADV